MLTFHNDPAPKAELLNPINTYVPAPSSDVYASVVMLDTIGSADWSYKPLRDRWKEEGGKG